MASGAVTIAFFGEDSGHVEVFRALAIKLFKEAGAGEPNVTEGSAAGGKGMAKRRLRAYLRASTNHAADFLVVLIDANSVGEQEQRREIRSLLEKAGVTEYAIGCPDPEIESWLLADREALSRGLMATVVVRGGTDPKDQLLDALLRAEIDPGASPTSVAYDVIPEMDLSKAHRTCPSLDNFVSELRAAAKRALDRQVREGQ